MIRLHIICAFVSIIIQVEARSQTKENEREQELEITAEALGENAAEEIEGFSLDHFKQDPLDLNSATWAELRLLTVLTDLQMSNFLSYRNRLGPLISVYELQAVPTWDVGTIKKLLHYITIAEGTNVYTALRARLKGGAHLILMRESRILEKSAGFRRTGSSFYLGSPDHLVLRYKYSFKNLLSFGVAAEKDPGEQFFRGAQRRGFDFYSIHFFARALGTVSAFALGDFTVNLGQGLLQWQSLAFKKGAEVLITKRQSAVLRPHTAAGENNFNRGVGVTLTQKHWELTTFGSSQKVSGQRVEDSASLESSFSRLAQSGLHRTIKEAAERYSARHNSFGGNLTYACPQVRLGLNAVSHHFSKPLHQNAAPYAVFRTSGKSWENYSLDFAYTRQNAHLFGEAAIDRKRAKAFIGGLVIAVDPAVDLSIIYRYLAPQYQSLYGNAFTESVDPSNEKGLYAGIVIRVLPNLRLNAYADHYSFPFIRYRLSAPAGGREYLLQTTFLAGKKTELSLRFKKEFKSVDAVDEHAGLNFPSTVIRQHFRLSLQYQLSQSVRLKARTDVVRYEEELGSNEDGYLTYVEGAYIGSRGLSAGIRMQFFDTDGYASRLYAYETDVLYSYRVPSFYRQGTRYFINGAWTLNPKCTIWVRWAQTLFSRLGYSGSGLDRIEGNRRSEVRLQVRFLL